MYQEMTLDEALTYCFDDIVEGNEKRKRFSSKNAADTYSESLKNLWAEGFGLVYGPFWNKNFGSWYEVSYKQTVYNGPKQYTKEEVEQQAERFGNFMLRANLVKIGNRYMYFMRNNNKDGRYNEYCYLLRVLRLLCNVSGNMEHPVNNWQSYYEVLEYQALNAFIESIGK